MARPEPAAAFAASACRRCGTGVDLYVTGCRHMTYCKACGYRMAHPKLICPECRIPITHLIMEYDVKPLTSSKQFFVGRFPHGMPNLDRKHYSDPEWNMELEGLDGRQPTAELREELKRRPFMLADDVGQQLFQGQREGGQQATFYVLVQQGKDMVATPVSSWYKFQKLAQYKQLTLEEAEEQMRNRRKAADGYERWLMKSSSTGAAAFNDMESIGGSGGGRSRRMGGDDDDNAGSDRGEEDEDEEETRKSRLRKEGAQIGEEDGQEPARHLDLDDEEPKKGDDWEHEETFTDDDEAVGHDSEGKEDINPEVPASPEIKQEEEGEAEDEEDEDEEDGEDDEDEEGDQHEGGRLSQSGKELKKLLGKSGDFDDLDGVEEAEDDDDVGSTHNPELLDHFGRLKQVRMSPVLLPSKKESFKEEAAEETPTSKAAAPSPAAARATPAPSTKGKRKSTADDEKPTAPAGKRAKAEQTVAGMASATSVKKESPSKPNAGAVPKSEPPTSEAAVLEEEVRNILAPGPMKITELLAKFRHRLSTEQDKTTFKEILHKISKIKQGDGGSYIVLRKGKPLTDILKNSRIRKADDTSH